jgi:hypothetical protein
MASEAVIYGITTGIILISVINWLYNKLDKGIERHNREDERKRKQNPTKYH